jgi:DNA-binding SARP family transcriptional activator
VTTSSPTRRPDAEPGGVDLTLLGGFTLSRRARPLPAPPAAQRVLAYLALAHDPVPRAHTAHALWPDADDHRAAARLRSALWRIPDSDAGPLVDHGTGALSLSPAVRVDTHHLERQTAALAGGREAAADALPEPRVLCRELLPEWDDDWLLTAREWLRQLRLRALERLCLYHCRAGDYDVALEAGLAAVSCEPLRESAHRMIAAVHLADGNDAEALRQYELYRLLLRDELGVGPSEKFRRLMAPLLGRPLDT